eukprot:GHVS01078371.1.p1 GENE.GHVS01078371.1~~GHVS01078371.1.p1  ORF type:complete len:562 (-),score=56.04 GHVS01078371.1:41-1726(-)
MHKMSATLVGSIAKRLSSVAASGMAATNGTMSKRVGSSELSRHGRTVVRCSAVASFSSSTFFPAGATNPTSLRDMKDVGQILSFVASSSDMSAQTLEAGLRALGHCRMLTEENEALCGDDRFINLLSNIRTRLPDMDTRSLSMIVSACALFGVQHNSLCDIAQKVAEIAMRRENSFHPRALSSMVVSLPRLLVRDPACIEFFRLEALKLLPEASPMDLHNMLDGFRMWGVLKRELADLITEKMSDEIDRYTSRDVCDTLKVLSAAGMARGFLIRRLSSLAFENLNQFTTRRLVSLLDSLSKLRFLTPENYTDVLDLIKQNTSDLYGPHTCKLLMALSMGNCTGEIGFVRTLVESKRNERMGMGRGPATKLAYSIMYFQLTEFDAYLTEILANIFDSVPEKYPIESKMLLKEIVVGLEIERPDLGIVVPPSWNAALEDRENERYLRVDASRMVSELYSLIGSMNGKYQLNVQRCVKVGNYKVGMVDEETKIVIEQDFLARPTNGIMKMRHLEKLGYRPVLIPFWQWRRCRSETDQILLVKHGLDFHLNSIGRPDMQESSAAS